MPDGIGRHGVYVHYIHTLHAVVPNSHLSEIRNSSSAACLMLPFHIHQSIKSNVSALVLCIAPLRPGTSFFAFYSSSNLAGFRVALSLFLTPVGLASAGLTLAFLVAVLVDPFTVSLAGLLPAVAEG